MNTGHFKINLIAKHTISKLICFHGKTAKSGEDGKTGKARNTGKAGNIGTTGRVVDWWTLVDR
jgi:hypothetical protein